MRKAFIDANVLVSVLNKEYPLFTHSSRLLSLADRDCYELYTSSLCLAIAFYFSCKKSGEQLAKRKIQLLNDRLKIVSITQKAVDMALENPQIHDLEDGFQYYAALEGGCHYMITENQVDFFFADIEVFGSEDFLIQKVFK